MAYSKGQIKIEQNGLACTVAYTDPETGDVFQARASMMFLRKSGEAQLDIIGDAIPEWMKVGQRVAVNIVWPSKGLVVLGGIISHTIGISIHVSNIMHRETIQRRRDVKVSYEVPADIRSNSIGVQREEYDTEEDIRSIQVQLENISAGGVGFKTELDTFVVIMLIPGKKIAISFETAPGKLVALPATIVRAEKKSDGLLHCGASFDRVRPGIEQQIRQIVFKQQRSDNEMERAIREGGLIQIDAFI